MNADLAMQRALDRFRRVGFAQLTEEEKVLATIWCFEAKVANGGLAYFYKSTDGDLASYAPIAFQAVGAPTQAEIAAQANAVFGPAGVPADRFGRLERLHTLPAAAHTTFDALEARYFELAGDLEERIESYLAAAKTATPRS